MAYKGQPVPTTVQQITRAKISDGKSLVVTVPASTKITAQTFVLLEGFFGVAMESVKTGAGETAEVAISIEQAEYESDQITTGDTYNVGTPLYFKESTKKFTATAEGNRLVGRVTSKKDANNVIQFILLPQIV